MKLLIPGPVTTHPDVRAAMAVDIAPWDNEVRPVFARIRTRLLALGGGVPATHAALPIQGSGHFGMEAALRSLLRPGERILIPMTGAYADRMARLARAAGREPVPLAASPTEPVDPETVRAALADPSIALVGLVQSETSSGIVNDLVAIGAAVRDAGRRLLVDAVSAFGALPLDLGAQPEIAAAVFTPNKCLEGMPGIAVALVRRDAMPAPGTAGSWCFDLADVLEHSEKRGWGTFRFTPPVQTLNALAVALDRLDAEGRVGRLARYTANAATLRAGMQALGLRPILDARHQGPIVSNIAAPTDAGWDLQRFVDALKRRGYLISNFYDTETPSFRVGTIGVLDRSDFEGFAAAVGETLAELGIGRRSAA
ncbi:MAG: aminotransferase class V-fold PLP-dependent enzyme [Rhodospirillales bacterium]|nr:aminotransferase class V-fold PLP-dependent enzyme [Rhodospirillales bacterium]